MTAIPNYPIDLYSVASYVATELEIAGGESLSLKTLARSYKYGGSPTDVLRVKRFEIGHEHRPVEEVSDYEAFLWMLTRVANYTEGIEVDGDEIKASRPLEEMRFDGQPVSRRPHDPHALHSGPFERTFGKYHENVRTSKNVKRDDTSLLKASMEAVGWLEHLPAIQDEHGILITGHRRLKVAKELGIKPNIVTVEFGSHDFGDEDRLKLAAISNIGAKPMTAADKEQFIEAFAKMGYTQKQICDVLELSPQLVSHHVARLKLDVKDGRRTLTRFQEQYILELLDAGISMAELSRRFKVTPSNIHRIKKKAEAKPEPEPDDDSFTKSNIGDSEDDEEGASEAEGDSPESGEDDDEAIDEALKEAEAERQAEAEKQAAVEAEERRKREEEQKRKRREEAEAAKKEALAGQKELRIKMLAAKSIKERDGYYEELRVMEHMHNLDRTPCPCCKRT